MTYYTDTSPYVRATAVDLSVTDASYANSLTPRGVYVGVTGDVKVDMEGAGTVTFKAAPVGILPIQVTKIYKTGTTATDLLALL